MLRVIASEGGTGEECKDLARDRPRAAFFINVWSRGSIFFVGWMQLGSVPGRNAHQSARVNAVQDMLWSS